MMTNIKTGQLNIIQVVLIKLNSCYVNINFYSLQANEAITRLYFLL